MFRWLTRRFEARREDDRRHVQRVLEEEANRQARITMEVRQLRSRFDAEVSMLLPEK